MCNGWIIEITTYNEYKCLCKCQNVYHCNMAAGAALSPFLKPAASSTETDITVISLDKNLVLSHSALSPSCFCGAAGPLPVHSHLRFYNISFTTTMGRELLPTGRWRFTNFLSTIIFNVQQYSSSSRAWRLPANAR